MLSENLQDRIGRNEASQACVPHGSQVLTRRFVKVKRKAFITDPLGLAIGRKTSSKSLCVLVATRLNGK